MQCGLAGRRIHIVQRLPHELGHLDAAGDMDDEAARHQIGQRGGEPRREGHPGREEVRRRYPVEHRGVGEGLAVHVRKPGDRRGHEFPCGEHIGGQVGADQQSRGHVGGVCQEGAQGKGVREHITRQLPRELRRVHRKARALRHMGDEVGAFGAGHRRHKDVSCVGGVREVLLRSGQDQAVPQTGEGAQNRTAYPVRAKVVQQHQKRLVRDSREQGRERFRPVTQVQVLTGQPPAERPVQPPVGLVDEEAGLGGGGPSRGQGKDGPAGSKVVRRIAQHMCLADAGKSAQQHRGPTRPRRRAGRRHDGAPAPTAGRGVEARSIVRVRRSAR